VRINIIGNNEIRSTVARSNVARDGLAEEIVDDRDARVVYGVDDVARRVDADYSPYLLVGQRPQQDAVVTTDLDHAGARRVDKARGDFAGIVDEVLAQRAYRGRKIEIIGE
jgi:hypothetical protein